MIAAEKLLRYLARLSVRGTQLPDKPRPKKLSRSALGAKRLRSKNSFGGRLSPTRCGLPAVQDRSARADVTTALDVAAAMTAIRSPLTRIIVEWLATSWVTQEKLASLISTLGDMAVKRFPAQPWLKSKAHREALLASVLVELRETEGCMKCNTNGVMYDPIAQEWVACPSCDGTGMVKLGYRRRLGRINANLSPTDKKVTDHQYRMHWAEVYQFMLDHCHQRISDAWHQIQEQL